MTAGTEERCLDRFNLAKEMSDFRISIFAVPKPFVGHIGTIQKNALRSWSRLPFVERIILIGDEIGTAAAAESIGATHLVHVERDSYGAPLLSDVFRQGSEAAPTEWLLYVNADILLTRRFAESAAKAAREGGSGLIISRRWNVDVTADLAVEGEWEDLSPPLGKPPELFSKWGIDVFVFPKELFKEVPPFSLGKSSYDNWLVNTARKSGGRVTDITEEATVMHQNHDYVGFSSMDEISRSQQGLRNFWLAGDSHFGMSNIYDATHVLKAGAIVPNSTLTVSIVIFDRGTLGELRGCVEALSYQSYPRTYLEIIVVGNSETFGGALVQWEFPFVKLTRVIGHTPALARNKGAAIATGDLLGFVDSNCRPASDWVEKAVATVQAMRCRCIVACNIQNGPSNDCAQRQPGEDITRAMFVPAEIWRQVGPFGEAAGDDSEWSSRASMAGAPLVYAPEAVVVSCA